MRILPAGFALLALCACLPAAAGPAAEEAPKPKPKPRACRSVHLLYQTGRATAYANEITVQASAPGTYFCVCGWDQGYFGIQELPNGKKVVIFSVWDSFATNDPRAVKPEDRTKMVFKDDAVRIDRFGGEGTGGKSFFDLDWKLGQTHRFMVSVQAAGDRTEYTGHLYMAETKTWKKLVTFSAPAKGDGKGGGAPVLADCHSFVEDFLRNGDSATHERKAVFGNGWVRDAEGKVAPITRARFSADRTPSDNIDAGTADGRFFLATGGPTVNAGARLWRTVELPADDQRAALADLPWPAEAVTKPVAKP